MTVESLNTKAKRLLELDALRGLAALFVVIYHYTVRYDHIYGNAYPLPFSFHTGQYGVLLFFIISGFVIFMTLERTRVPMDFVVSRFSRLYPTYWSCLLITFLTVSFFSLPGRELPLGTALLNMSMLQNYFNLPNVDGVYWTLFIELAFYALMFLLFITKRLKDVNVFGLILLAAIVAVNTIVDTAKIPAYHHLEVLLLLGYGNLFFAGILFYKLRTKGNAWQRHAMLALCLAVQYIISPIEVALVVTGCFAVFYLFIYNRLSVVINKPCVFLGHISYSLYLLYQNIGYVVIRYLFAKNVHPWLVVLIPIVVVVLLAAGVTYLIEKPALHAIRSYYRRYKEARL